MHDTGRLTGSVALVLLSGPTSLFVFDNGVQLAQFVRALIFHGCVPGSKPIVDMWDGSVRQIGLRVFFPGSLTHVSVNATNADHTF